MPVHHAEIEQAAQDYIRAMQETVAGFERAKQAHGQLQRLWRDYLAAVDAGKLAPLSKGAELRILIAAEGADDLMRNLQKLAGR
jgi:hypothetical protein